MSGPRVALVHDWLTNSGGAEKLLYSLHKAFPDAPIYTSVFDPTGCPQFAEADVRTTYLQKLPKSLRFRHQLWPLLRTQAFRSLDLSDYDVVISSASAEAKAVRTRKGAVHICYCHTPTRYYWSHYDDYKQNPGFGRLDPLVRAVLPLIVGWMRRLDLSAVKGVDYFIANSNEVQARIRRYYQRDAEVVFPPVDTARLRPPAWVPKQPYYLAVGRQIPYKRLDLAVEACSRMGRRLVVIGRGSQHETLKSLAGPTVDFRFIDDDTEIVRYFLYAQALLFPALEDFGITPVEAIAAGTPVIAYRGGGALDYVVDGETGVFFDEQTVDALAGAIQRFETLTFDQARLVAFAENFSEARFVDGVRAFVAERC